MNRNKKLVFSKAVATLLAAACSFGIATAAPGKWTVEKVSATSAAYDTSELYGTTFTAYYTLKYVSGSGDLVEPPMLDWHEKFILIDHKAKERWVFEDNMYDLKPYSKTLEIWNARYIAAYDAAAGAPDMMIKGSSKLQTLKGVAVKKTDLDKAASGPEKANAVRKYLKKNGGILQITIIDIPSLNIPKAKDERKERLLLFDCGVVGGALRQKAAQYVEVDGAKPKTGWKRTLTMKWDKTDLPLPTGFKEIPAPGNVSTKGDRTMMGGRYL
jgi:hypothetical protein